MLVLGILLAGEWLDVDVPEPVRVRAAEDDKVGWLTREVRRLLLDPHPSSESEERFGSLEHDLFHFRLRKRFRDKVRFIGYRLTTPSRPDEWHPVRIGFRSVPLHALTRPLKLGVRLLPALWWYVRHRSQLRGSSRGRRASGDGVTSIDPQQSAGREPRTTKVAPLDRRGEFRVLQLVQTRQRRGAAVFAVALSEEFRERGLAVRTVYLYGYAGTEPLPLAGGDIDLRGRQDHPFELLPGLQPGLLKRVREAIRDFRPDIVQVNGGRTVKYGAAARRLAGDSHPWKLIYRNIGMPSDWHSSWHRLAAYQRAIMPEIDGVIGVTGESLRDATRLYGLDVPMEIIWNGVDPKKLSGVDDPTAVRTAFGAAPDDRVMLFLGSLSEEKRPDRFLHTVQAVSESIPTVRAWIVGDGPVREGAERLARELGVAERCSFFGFQDDVAPFLAAADALLITSDSEGMPAVALEAGYLGLPVVSTRVGGLAECIEDGATGFLVNSDDKLVDATVRLLSDAELRRRIGEGAGRHIREHFTIGRIADRYLEFYHRVLGTSPEVRAA